MNKHFAIPFYGVIHEYTEFTTKELKSREANIRNYFCSNLSFCALGLLRLGGTMSTFTRSLFVSDVYVVGLTDACLNT